jgi:hypothetical protein
MAKRSRGSRRPGHRPPKARPARPGTATGIARPATALSPVEEARAAELEAQIMAEERAAESERNRGRERARARSEAFETGSLSRPRAGSLLAARASEEYTYVVRDVRRIVRVGGGLLVVLFVLFLLIDVFSVIKI